MTGEFRRCYNDDEMINVLGWYEILFAVGLNLGPGLPVLFSFVNIEIGWWKINENNIIQVITAFSVSLIFIIAWFQVIDLSKELDSIRSEFDEISLFSSSDENEQVNKQKSPNGERKLMEWKDLLEFDILLLALSYAFMRWAVTISVTDVTLVSTKTFHWKMNTLAWLHVILGSSSYVLITLLVKFKVSKGRRTIFFPYVVANCIALVIFSILMLPKAIDFTNLPSQFLFGGSILFLKCFVYFQAQSSGKFLIFNTVSFDNANFVDGFRSFVGEFFRLFARGSLFYFFLYPEYFVPPIFSIGIIITLLLLFRRRIHL